MTDCTGQPIQKGDIIIHSDKLGLWFGYFVEVKCGRLHYVIIGQGSTILRDLKDSFSNNVHDGVTYGAASHKVVNITKSELGQKIKKSKSYRNIQRNNKWK